MKVILKTITGKQHEVDVESTTTTLDVKKLLEDEYEPASLRLCFNGTVLEDGKSLMEAGVKEGNSIVLAGRKRKIPKPAAPPPAGPANTGVPPPSEAPAPSVTPPMAAASAPAPTPVTTPPVEAPAAAPAGPNTYGVAASLIDEVASMGFEDRTQIAMALRAAFMNVERAVEYLFEGIPPAIVQELTRHEAAPAPSASAPAGAPAPTAAPSAAAGPAAATAEAGMRAALARIPQFDEIRALYNQNTETMPVVLQQIALRHPTVYEQIERDPETFLAIMSEPGQPGTSSAVAASTAHGVATSASAETDSFINQLQADVDLSPEDTTAVQQLVELGGGMWDEQSAVLVYLATQRNQEVAASILFEHGGVPSELLAEIATQMVNEDAEEEEEGDYEDEH